MDKIAQVHVFPLIIGKKTNQTGVGIDKARQSDTDAADLDPGTYQLTVQDQEGFTKSVQFTVYKKSSDSN